MTCVWDSIISGLSDLFRKADNGRELFDIILPILNRSDFIIFCEKYCDYMLSNYEYIRLNSEPISRQEIEVCIKRIKELDQIDKQDGYNVGAADSFLLFICIFFRINIIHTGQAHYITIDNKPYSPSMINNKHQAICNYCPFTCHVRPHALYSLRPSGFGRQGCGRPGYSDFFNPVEPEASAKRAAVRVIILN